MTKREEQKTERRNAILMVGLELFIRKGYNATKITDIAKELNMSVGLLFHYFESKEKLYEELVRLGLSGTQNIMELDTNQPLVFFREVVSTLFSSMKEPTVTKMFVLMYQASMNEAVPQVVKELVAQVSNIQASVPVIMNGQKLGLIKEGDPVALSTAFWSSIQGIAEELAINPDTPIPEPEWIVDIIRKHVITSD